MRLHELAWELRRTSAELIEASGLSSHMCNVDEATEQALRRQLPRRRSLFELPKKRPGPRQVCVDAASVYYGGENDRDESWAGDRDSRAFWTTRDAARHFKVKPATVRQWVRRGYVTPVGFDRGSLVFRRAEIQAAHADIRARAAEIDHPRINLHPRYWDRQVEVGAAARILRVAPSTVRSWISRGRLKAYRSDGRTFVRLGPASELARKSRRQTSRN